MQCKDIMRAPVARLGVDTSVAAVAMKMRDEQAGLLVICDEASKVVGVLTDRDLALRVCAEGRSALDTKAGDVMTREVIRCQPDDELEVAEKLMLQHQKSRMIVTEDDGTLRGIISLTDLAQCEQPLCAAQLLRQISAREYRMRPLHDV